MELETAAQCLGPILGARIGGKSRSRYLSDCLAFGSTHPIDEIEPAHLRHAQIHEQYVRRHALQEIKRMLPRMSGRNGRTGRLEDLPDERERVAVIIDRQDMNSVKLRDGNVMFCLR